MDTPTPASLGLLLLWSILISAPSVVAANIAFAIAYERLSVSAILQASIRRFAPTAYYGFLLSLPGIGAYLLCQQLGVLFPPAAELFLLLGCIVLALCAGAVAWTSVRPGVRLTRRACVVALCGGFLAWAFLGLGLVLMAMLAIFLVIPASAMWARPTSGNPYDWAIERPLSAKPGER